MCCGRLVHISPPLHKFSGIESLGRFTNKHPKLNSSLKKWKKTICETEHHHHESLRCERWWATFEMLPCAPSERWEVDPLQPLYKQPTCIYRFIGARCKLIRCPVHVRKRTPDVPSLKLTKNPKIDPWKRGFLLQTIGHPTAYEKLSWASHSLWTLKESQPLHRRDSIEKSCIKET